MSYNVKLNLGIITVENHKFHFLKEPFDAKHVYVNFVLALHKYLFGSKGFTYFVYSKNRVEVRLLLNNLLKSN